MDLIIKQNTDQFRDIHQIASQFIMVSCMYGNLPMIIYIINTFGKPEKDILAYNKDFSIRYISCKNGNCIDLLRTDPLNLVMINGHIDILEYFEKYAIRYNTFTTAKRKLFVDVNIALKNGHFHIADWCNNNLL